MYMGSNLPHAHGQQGEQPQLTRAGSSLFPEKETRYDQEDYVQQHVYSCVTFECSKEGFWMMRPKTVAVLIRGSHLPVIANRDARDPGHDSIHHSPESGEYDKAKDDLMHRCPTMKDTSILEEQC